MPQSSNQAQESQLALGLQPVARLGLHGGGPVGQHRVQVGDGFSGQRGVAGLTGLLHGPADAAGQAGRTPPHTRLPLLVSRPGVHQVSVGIDQSWRNQPACGVDRLLRLDPGQKPRALADGDDPAGPHRHRAVRDHLEPRQRRPAHAVRRAAAGHDLGGVADEQVDRLHLRASFHGGPSLPHRGPGAGR